MDPAKVLFIAVAALIVLGPERLPAVARRAGELWSLARSPTEWVAKHLGEVAHAAGIPEDVLRIGLPGGLDRWLMASGPATSASAQGPAAPASPPPGQASSATPTGAASIVAGPWELN
ncbi:twin-arginine translocation protein, TatB subunit [Acidimicrobium ferrooxidans DSM 10331]|uniref:Twin-arginine translocation protein, TatB subunit n=1 Tax=Acidimicrobium ferrooxidans (strain DSM 10331 / JCM 15462 / NBRC 103882 / ICP) TaxID=525909 RepID=C7LYQ3_ACIFD|nr:twin-arginine translocase TatA/TatE family subunit [Acidimicrobium ferrooxidans]ACU53861.1 twin-arginine translocation protein, TatB subunit [Acidimicrobium ferrooxidans DSM 10331]